MAINFMVDFAPEDFPSANSDSEFFREHHVGSSSHAPPPPPPTTTATRVVIVKVASGCDIIESILDVARRNQTSLTIQSAFGSIASVTLRNIDHGVPAIIAYGPFNILSLTGSYFYDDQSASPPSFSFGIHLSTSHGRVFGGNVGGQVIAYRDVNLIVFTFNNPEIHKYISEPEDEDDDDPNNEADFSAFNSSN